MEGRALAARAERRGERARANGLGVWMRELLAKQGALGPALRRRPALPHRARARRRSSAPGPTCSRSSRSAARAARATRAARWADRRRRRARRAPVARALGARSPRTSSRRSGGGATSRARARGSCAARAATGGRARARGASLSGARRARRRILADPLDGAVVSAAPQLPSCWLGFNRRGELVYMERTGACASPS